jgi:hypothetical protein
MYPWSSPTGFNLLNCLYCALSHTYFWGTHAIKPLIFCSQAVRLMYTVKGKLVSLLYIATFENLFLSWMSTFLLSVRITGYTYLDIASNRFGEYSVLLERQILVFYWHDESECYGLDVKNEFSFCYCALFRLRGKLWHYYKLLPHSDMCQNSIH